MSRNTCQLGEECDLTVAWMAGRESAKDEAKARIEELEAKACDNFQMYVDANEARIDAEAKLAKAVKALDEAWFMLTVPHLNYEPEPEEPGLRRIKTTLAELNGEK